MQRRLKRQGKRPFSSQVHLVESDQDIRRYEETILDDEGGGYGGGGDRGGNGDTMEYEFILEKLELAHGAAPDPGGIP